MSPHAHFHSQTCFEAAQSVWVPNHFCPQKCFFSICIQLKLRQRFQTSSLNLSLTLMIHVVARLFNTFAFIYMFCNNYARLNTTKKKIWTNSYPSAINLERIAVFQVYQSTIISPLLFCHPKNPWFGTSVV